MMSKFDRLLGEGYEVAEAVEEYVNEVDLGYAVDKAVDAAFEVMWEEIEKTDLPKEHHQKLFDQLNNQLVIRYR